MLQTLHLKDAEDIDQYCDDLDELTDQHNFIACMQEYRSRLIVMDNLAGGAEGTEKQSYFNEAISNRIANVVKAYNDKIKKALGGRKGLSGVEYKNLGLMYVPQHTDDAMDGAMDDG
jgi:hypothetical protein